MENVRLKGRIYVDSSNVMMPCNLDDPRCQTVEICWDGGSALLNEDRLEYVREDFAAEQWDKTLAAARLMAAAPDLLAALEDVVKSAQSKGWGAYMDLWDALIAAEKAIARAKGGE
jgi:hypothetical protein